MALRAYAEWLGEMHETLGGVADDQLAIAAQELRAADLVLTAGNGGSAALASHMAQALLKPGYVAGGGVAAVCLNDNVPTWSAHANDGGWGTALLECALPFLKRGLRCALLLISSSGRSQNIVKLADYAKTSGHRIVSLTGFDGEPLKGLSTLNLHVASRDYEVIEPAHDALIHRIQAHLR